MLPSAPASPPAPDLIYVPPFKEAPVDKILKEILVDCGKPGTLFNEDAKTSLFKECLEKVLPICNGEPKAKSKNDKIKAKSCEIRENLEEYSGLYNAHEKELYLPFVKTANTALLFLQELKVEHLRGANDLICFHVLDPSMLQQKHKTPDRRPDVIVVSETNLRRDAAHVPSEYDDPTSDFLPEVTAKSSPETPFKWRDIRTFVEFKRNTKVKIDPPPKAYTYQSHTTAPTTEYLGLEGHEYVHVSALPATPAMSGANPQLDLKPGPVRRSARQQEKAMATDSSDRKRTSSAKQFSPSASLTKRPRSSEQDAIVQAGDYAAELFSTHAGRLHVFGLIIVGDILYLWRYDREGAIQCSGFNFIQDLPRFLVLLLAMQRFNNRDWGLNPYIDPDFGERRPHETTLTGAKDKQITLTLEFSDADRVTHFGLSGRGTNVFSVKCSNLSGEDDLVVKLFWPETKRTSEPDILKKVDDIAKHHDDVKGHVPQMLWHRKFEDTSTAKIRERLGLPSQGSRVLYMIIFRRLRPIHELVGNDFLQAWWATVKCHLALWKNEVYHRDISDSNLMYYKDEKGNVVGVLNDFDLATTKEIATGTQRTGTLPFMALALLEDAEGRTQHLYEHDAESFIWVLIWICLQYSNGAPRQDKRPLDVWLEEDATQCQGKKCVFLLGIRRWDLLAGEGHERSWELAKDCIRALLRRIVNVQIAASMDHSQTWDTDEVFNTLLQKPYSNLSNV